MPARRRGPLVSVHQASASPLAEGGGGGGGVWRVKGWALASEGTSICVLVLIWKEVRSRTGPEVGVGEGESALGTISVLPPGPAGLPGPASHFCIMGCGSYAAS